MTNTLNEYLKNMECQNVNVAEDNLEEFAQVLQNNLNADFNTNVFRTISFEDDMTIDIYIGEIQICTLETDSDGEHMWISEIR